MKPQIKLNEQEEILVEMQPNPNVVWVWVYFFALSVIGFGLLIGLMLAFPPNRDQPSLSILLALFPRFMLFIQTYSWSLGVGVFLVLLIIFYLLANAAHKKTWYFLTNQRCIQYSGFLGINKRAISLNRIVNLASRQSLFEKCLKLTRVVLIAPSGSALRGRIVLFGLSPEEAQNVLDLIEKVQSNKDIR